MKRRVRYSEKAKLYYEPSPTGKYFRCWVWMWQTWNPCLRDRDEVL